MLGVLRPLVGCALAIALLSACGGSGSDDAGASATPPNSPPNNPPTTPPGTPPTNPPTTPPAGNGDQYGSGPDTLPDPSGNPSSVQLIATAQLAGAITQEQALLYELYADFGDPRLPAQYRGDDAAVLEGHAFGRIADYVTAVGEANVSPTMMAVLRTFMTPPYYAGSWWQSNSNPQSTNVADTRVGAHNATALLATKIGWTGVGGTNVVVWYKNEHAATDAAKASSLAGEFDAAIWPRLTTLMGRTPRSDLGTGGILDIGVVWTEDDGRLDVFLDDLPTGNEGKTLPIGWSNKDTAVRVFLNRGLPMRGLIAQAAHEFMHAIQYSYPVRAASLNDYHTIKEATATWASHYVYPANRWETKYASHYLENGWVSSSYDDRSTPGLFRYGAYVFPLFLESRFSSSIVRNIWEKTLSFNSEMLAIEGAIIDAGSTFELEWPRFIAANWNRETLNRYASAGVTVGADTESDTTLSLSNGFGFARQDIELPHASMAFYRVNFASSDARSVTFVNGINYAHDVRDLGPGESLTFTGLTPSERRGVSMQVFLRVNGAWQSDAVDLTNAPWFSVCRDNPAGRIDEIVFMYGNAEITSGNPNYTALRPRLRAPGIVATDIGCRDWTGSLSVSRPFDVGTGAETLTINNITLRNTMNTDAPTPGPGPAYLLAPGDEVSAGYGFTYATVGGTATWNYHHYISPPANCTYDGSRTFSIAGAALPAHLFTNWTPPGSASRGVILPALMVNVISTVATLPVDWRCVDSDGEVTTGTDIEGTELDIHVTTEMQAVRIASGGLTVSGTGAQSGANHATGSWTFTGATQ